MTDLKSDAVVSVFIDANPIDETKDKMMTVKILAITRSGVQGKLWGNKTFHSEFSVPSTATARDLVLLLPEKVSHNISSFEISNSGVDETVTDTASDIFGTDANPDTNEYSLSDIYGETRLFTLGLQDGETLRFYSREGEDCYGRPLDQSIN